MRAWLRTLKRKYIAECGGGSAKRFVPIKDVEQQAVLTNRARELLVSERTAAGTLGEYGLVLGQGVAQMSRSVAVYFRRR